MKRQGRNSEIESYLSTSKLQALNKIKGEKRLQIANSYSAERKNNWNSCLNAL